MRFFKTNKQKYDEAFMEVNPFGKVPDGLKGMSLKEISGLLSSHSIESPDHFRLVHELDRRISQPQVRATYVGIVASLLGIVLGWMLHSWFPSETNPAVNIIINDIKKHDQGNPSNSSNDNTGNKILPSSSTIAKPVQPINNTDSQTDNYQNKRQRNNTETK